MNIHQLSTYIFINTRSKCLNPAKTSSTPPRPPFLSSSTKGHISFSCSKKSDTRRLSSQSVLLLTLHTRQEYFVYIRTLHWARPSCMHITLRRPSHSAFSVQRAYDSAFSYANCSKAASYAHCTEKAESYTHTALRKVESYANCREQSRVTYAHCREQSRVTYAHCSEQGRVVCLLHWARPSHMPTALSKAEPYAHCTEQGRAICTLQQCRKAESSAHCSKAGSSAHCSNGRDIYTLMERSLCGVTSRLNDHLHVLRFKWWI